MEAGKGRGAAYTPGQLTCIICAQMEVYALGKMSKGKLEDTIAECYRTQLIKQKVCDDAMRTGAKLWAKATEISRELANVLQPGPASTLRGASRDAA